MTLLSSSPAQGLSSADLLKLKHFVSENLTREIESENPPYAQRETFVRQKLAEVFGRLKANIPDSIRQQITQEVVDEVLGYGPIQPLLNDPDVSEVMVNGPKKFMSKKRAN